MLWIGHSAFGYCGYRVKDSHVVQFEGYEIGDYLLAV